MNQSNSISSSSNPQRRCAIVIECGAGSVLAVAVDELGNVAGIRRTY
jgi:hypothetical protein